MHKLSLLWLNTLTLIATLLVNYLVGSGVLGTRTVGDISAAYPVLITPAGYAFSIWGLIYLMLIAFVGYQWYTYKNNKFETSLLPTGIFFAISNVANALWISAWVQEYLGYSLIFMFILLLSLIVLVVRLRLEVWNAPLGTIFFVWWPICIYIGWIILASVTNVAVYLNSEQLLVGAESGWTIAMLIIAGLIYGFLVYQRNMREAAMVGVWGLAAIASKQWNAVQEVAITAIIIATLLTIYAVYHGYKNRATSPLAKLKNS